MCNNGFCTNRGKKTISYNTKKDMTQKRCRILMDIKNKPPALRLSCLTCLLYTISLSLPQLPSSP